ncbi:MAG: tetratricopeptide repeat protein [Pyrinomonadaceae bacterium MAG19_C2-C3]|nr:tetratricopeptide repeat protein [Pyrinomonadaceae bacterium MAG19_C2-C3]
MTRNQTMIAFLLLIVVQTASGCGFINNIRAKQEVNDGARAYKAGDFKEAQAHFESALELDPNQENAPIFRARAIQRQYRAGVSTPENQALAEQAIAAYEDMLRRDPSNEEAYNAIVQLYGLMKQEDKQREYLQRTANDQQAPGAKRAIAYAFLAGKQWRCSYDITEQTDNMQTVQRDNKTIKEYKKPADEAEFERARQCSNQGLELANQAVALDPTNDAAWAVKSNLLLEMSKMAQMEKNPEVKANFDRQYEEAIAKNRELSEIKRARKEEEKQRKAAEKAAKEG